MISPSITYTPGFYGKLPVQGDFVSRRLPASFIQAWDRWLQTVMASSKESLGNGWENAYLSSPSWRFVLNPGVCDKSSWAGIVIPSVDKVGRFFPLTLAVNTDRAKSLLRLFVYRADWFESLEKLAEAALHQKFSMDDFEKQLTIQNLTFPEPEKAITDLKNDHTDEGSYGWDFEIKDAKHIPDACIQLSEIMLSAYLSEYTFWCTKGSQSMSPSFRVYAGLPPSSFYTELLTRHRDVRNHEPGKHDVLSMMPDFEPAPKNDLDGHSETETHINWISSASSTVGAVHEIYEDAFLDSPEHGLWAVADGMGGHSAGDVASRTAVQALGDLSGSDNIEAFVNDVTECLQRVNIELIEKADGPHPEQIIGSTIVTMLAVGNRCASIWAGDSRLYRYRDGVLKQLTYDHTLPVKVSIADFFADEAPAGGDHNNAICKAFGGYSGSSG